MPLKRKFERNEGKRLHQRARKRLFSYDSGLPERKPSTAPKRAQNKPQEPRGTRPRKPHICPPFKPQIQEFISFCPFEVSQNTEKTLNHSKKYFIFAPFEPILSRFALLPVVLILPRESRRDRGREAQHHPTKRGTKERACTAGA